jgi:hypothetical protein
MKKFNEGIKAKLTHTHHFLGGAIGINTTIYILDVIQCVDFESGYAFVIGFEYECYYDMFQNIDIVDAYMIEDYDKYIESFK